jgi:hypothetical protein
MEDLLVVGAELVATMDREDREIHGGWVALVHQGTEDIIRRHRRAAAIIQGVD